MEKMFQLYLPQNIWEWLQKQKEETNTSIAETIRAALRDYIKRQKQEQEQSK